MASKSKTWEQRVVIEPTKDNPTKVTRNRISEGIDEKESYTIEKDGEKSITVSRKELWEMLDPI